MSIDEAINGFEKLASNYEFNLNMHKNHVMNLSVNDIERMQEYLEENRQLAEWLKRLKRIEDYIADGKDDMECTYSLCFWEIEAVMNGEI